MKIVKRYPGDWELYNVKEDRTESLNLIEKMPEKAKYLIAKYNEWAAKSKVVDWKELQTKIHNH